MAQPKAAPGLFERLSAALKTSEGEELKQKVKVNPELQARSVTSRLGPMSWSKKAGRLHSQPSGATKKLLPVSLESSYPIQSLAPPCFSSCSARYSFQPDVAMFQGLIVFDIDKEKWTLDLRPGKGSVAKSEPAAGDKPDLTLTITDENFSKLTTGKLGPQQVQQSLHCQALFWPLCCPLLLFCTVCAWLVSLPDRQPRPSFSLEVLCCALKPFRRH